MTMNEIYPIHERMLQRTDKERLLKQCGILVWFTGLSGSGKSTLAIALEEALYRQKYMTTILDGDNIRNGINSNLGFSPQDRIENIRRIAEIAKLFVHNGIVTIAAFISPTKEMRSIPRNLLGEDFVEIFVDTPLEVCEQRDVKGLYAKARRGEIKEFTGISSLFEKPINPELTLDTSKIGIRECTENIMNILTAKIRY